MQAGREIKFRSMDIQGKWHYGNLSTLQKAYKGINAGSYISNEAGAPFAYAVRPETVGQFTGLLDKKGREIYEGDIVKTHNQNNIVQYEHSSFMLVGLHEDKYERKYAHLKDYLIDITIPNVEGSKYDGITIKLEVIGNIYENPELLEVGK